MTLQTILNLFGLVTNMIGAYLMYHFTPKVQSQIYFYSKAENNEMRKKDVYKNKMVRIGMLVLFVGFMAQLIAMTIPL